MALPVAPSEPFLDDPWSCIRVVRCLEVGRVQVEPSRVVAIYTLVGDHGTSSIDLVYRYEQQVFDPDDPVSRNLASMIVAQVALNYGLFCEEIRFRGLYDATDRKFLREMTENTAREITVKKFLEPNPFLRGQAATLPVVRRPRYSWARLRFQGPATPIPSGGAWPRDGKRHAVLSSGGKESLLTFGLLREIGRETYPVFVNESGRHWLSALNGYRHLAAHHPGTMRVWTNCDRVFNWFLRHLPFVRKDFADIRSDAYPIRLWTVAVFLFGALPLLRQHRIGRISIGDEYDTSRRVRASGIPHYDGLYDQSRYFDEALTRYYGKKGWGVRQFSLLRSLSEILVQKTLAERYPDLFEHQVSCHATHSEEERVYPCGRCEKCRRIVGMLVAMNLDPRVCGYTQPQIEACLLALTTRGIHQEEEGSQHLAYLLGSRGKITSEASGLPVPKARPEVMKLRFTALRPPWDDLPLDVATSVYPILMEHAEGAVRRIGGRWTTFNPLAGEAE